MARSNADLVAIRAELTNDPLLLGLTILAADDEANSVTLNLVRDTIQIDRESIPANEIAGRVDGDEYAALAPADRQWLDYIGKSGTINPKLGSEVRERLLQIFSAQSETRTNLLAILTAPGNRIEQLFKAGTLQAGGTVSPSDVANARNAV